MKKSLVLALIIAGLGLTSKVFADSVAVAVPERVLCKAGQSGDNQNLQQFDYECPEGWTEISRFYSSEDVKTLRDYDHLVLYNYGSIPATAGCIQKKQTATYTLSGSMRSNQTILAINLSCDNENSQTLTDYMVMGSSFSIKSAPIYRPGAANNNLMNDGLQFTPSNQKIVQDKLITTRINPGSGNLVAVGRRLISEVDVNGLRSLVKDRAVSAQATLELELYCCPAGR